MKIALVQCPSYSVDTPPLGIAYLCAVLKKEGYSLKVFDFNAELYDKYKEYWKPEKEWSWYANKFFLEKSEFEILTDSFAGEILNFCPDAIGFSVQSTSAVFSLRVADKIRQRDKSKIIIFGGPECFREKAETFLNNSELNFVISGEGEETLVELLRVIKTGSSLSACNGLTFYSGGKIICNAPRKEIEDLNFLPYPDFSFFTPGKYLHKGTLPMLSSRGCINRCTFCLDTWYQYKYRSREPENVVGEIEYLIEKHGVKYIRFNDLLLNGNLEKLEKMCDLLIKKNASYVSWVGNAVARDMNKKLLKKMRRAGCVRLIFGIESCSSKILGLMRKNTKVEEISSLLKKSANAGIEVVTNWIVGFPGETREDFMETIRFILAHQRYIFSSGSANILSILPRSIIAKDLEKFNVEFGKDLQTEWLCRDNNISERRHRQRIFNKFLVNLGILDNDDNGREHQSFFRNIILSVKRGKILNEIKKELYANT